MPSRPPAGVHLRRPLLSSGVNRNWEMCGRISVTLSKTLQDNLSKYQLSAQSLNIQQYKLHYTPQHVSNSTLRIIRRTNLTPQPLVSSLSVSSRTLCGWRAHTVRLLIEGDDTRGCGDTIVPPDDEQRADRNTLRSIM